MPNSQKPTITPEHHERLAEIMKTPTRPNAPTDNTAPTPSKISAILASLPKPKGVGNKMFIFTGKKKIVLEPGGEKEIHDVKTVDAKSNIKPVEEKHTEEKKETTELKQPPSTAAAIADPKKSIKPEEKADKKTQPKTSKLGVFLVILIVVLGAWTLFWLYFLDFI
ncbi:MAG: hypothetical protein KA035_00260 [Candidatus Levybacteria bacterium]|nr:hypothetical protein [Candidatus Levybacteria bacterium]